MVYRCLHWSRFELPCGRYSGSKDELHERTCLWSRADARPADWAVPDKDLQVIAHGQAILYNPRLRISSSSNQDYAGSGPFPLSFVRTYNSVAVRTETLAGQWRHNYDRTVQLTEGQNPPLPTRSAPTGASHASPSPVRFGRPMRIFRIDWSNSRTAYGQPIGWRYANARDDTVEEYNFAGQLLSITNRAGLAQRLTWGGARVPSPTRATPAGSSEPVAGQLWCVTDPVGHQLVFSYDQSGRLSKVFDPAGNQFVYGYDLFAGGHLISVTYPDTEVRGYLYNESTNTSGANLPYALTGVTDENGSRYATYKYDSAGQRDLI